MAVIEQRFTPNGNRKPIIDNHSDSGGVWGVYNKDFSNYLIDIRHAAPKDRLLEILVRLKEKDHPVVVDAMAPTDALFDLKTKVLKHPKMRGIAIGLAENREPSIQKRDKEADITYLTGNLRTDAAWEELTQTAGANNVDLFIERADGGLAELPTRASFYSAAMDRIWNLLSPDHGTAILQLPPADELAMNGISLNKWIARVKQSGIVCEYTPWYLSTSDVGESYGMLLIEKNSSTLTLPIPEPGELIPDAIPTYPKSLRAELRALLLRVIEETRR